MTLIPSVFKVCNYCGEKKPVTHNFSFSRHYDDNYNPTCKDCRKAYKVKNSPSKSNAVKVDSNGNVIQKRVIQPLPSPYKTRWITHATR